MVIGTQPVYIGPNGMKTAPGGLLLGRPMILTDVCKTVGDKGDIHFVNLQYYRAITKAGGIQTATSLHLFFDYDMAAFRATFRVDGQPAISASVTPANGSSNRSAFVTLDARA
jgi:HK97 family phage major capsid protein